MSLMFPSQNFTVTAAQQPVISPTINSGVTSGNLYANKGYDFLDPDQILKDINKFSGSVSPVKSNTWTGQLVPGDPYGQNADSSQILKNTNSTINSIFSPSFGQNLNFTIPIVPGFYQPVPDLGTNPDPTRITLSSTFFANNIQAPTQVNNPNNFNPLMWQNPNSNNILLGIQQAQNSLLQGLSLGTGAYPSTFSLMA